MKANLELSVIVLCYRAEESIIPFSQNLKKEISKHTDNFEIILVGNYLAGTVDKTVEIIKDIAEKDPVFKTISKVKDGMMGWDVRQGLSMSTGNMVSFIDGDGQFPVEAVGECYKSLKNSNYGLVKTYRVKRNDGFQRGFISVIYNIVFKVLYPKVKSRDINSKPKMFLRSVYEDMDLTFDDWFIDAEIMIKASRLNIPFYEFPIEFQELKNRNSFVNYKTIIEFIRNLISFRLKGKK